jgi:hypothetical protein
MRDRAEAARYRQARFIDIGTPESLSAAPAFFGDPSKA